MLPTFDVPPIGPMQTKVWGTTQLFFVHNGVEGHVIRFSGCGFCSKHRHEHKWNRFMVLKGKLLVRTFCGDSNEDILDEIHLEAGKVTDVPPGVWHQFEGFEDGVAVEMYWTPLDANDIERAFEGGVRDGN